MCLFKNGKKLQFFLLPPTWNDIPQNEVKKLELPFNDNKNYLSVQFEPILTSLGIKKQNNFIISRRFFVIKHIF